MTEPLLPGPIWLVGCGNMAGAMLAGWLARGADPRQVTVIRPSGAPGPEGVRVLRSLPEDEVPALVLLGFKPQQLDSVSSGLAPALEAETILISILAGVEAASLRARFAAPRSILRAMPNLPVRLNKGVIALFAQEADEGARATVERLMAALGQVEWFDDESLFQIAGIVGGAGPAFLFRFIDALASGAAALGMSDGQAARIALHRVEGAAAQAAASGESPAGLARRVASPKGTTEAGLAVLDRQDGLAALVRETLEAARRRSREMAEAARGRSD